jgi:hypothetical protein
VWQVANSCYPETKLVWIIFFCQTLCSSAFLYFLISLTFDLAFLNLELFGKVLISLAILCSCYDAQKDVLTFTKVDKFLPDKVYYHGCLKSFLQITKWKGPEVCFIYVLYKPYIIKKKIVLNFIIFLFTSILQ